jgi:hypothetical protein
MTRDVMLIMHVVLSGVGKDVGAIIFHTYSEAIDYDSRENRSLKSMLLWIDYSFFFVSS